MKVAIATGALAVTLAGPPAPAQAQDPPPAAPAASAEAARSGDNARAVPRAAATSRAPERVVSSGANDDQQGGVRRPPGSDGGRSGSGAQGRGGRGSGSQPDYPVDRAVPRGSVPHAPPPVHVYRSRPWPWYYDPWGYHGGYYGAFGIGYTYYAPWAWYGPGPVHYGAPYGAYGWDIGSVKLKIAPRDAEVFVDGYYAGTVDDFDGTFQSLKLDSGNYRIEIRKPGYETLTYDVRVQPDRTITFRREMRQVP